MWLPKWLRPIKNGRIRYAVKECREGGGREEKRKTVKVSRCRLLIRKRAGRRACPDKVIITIIYRFPTALLLSVTLRLCPPDANWFRGTACRLRDDDGVVYLSSDGQD